MRSIRGALLAVSALLACDSRVAVTHAPAVSSMPTPAPPTVPAVHASGGPVEPLVAAPARRPGAWANNDPTDDLVPGPPDVLEDCDEQLAQAGVRYRRASLPVHAEHQGKLTCGAPQVLVYSRGPGGIAYDPPPLLTCPMALALASFEKILQEEALAEMHAPLVRIEQLGTYSCREIVAFPGWVSEHSYANAIDLSRFVFKNGVTVSVAHDFDQGDDAPKRSAGLFLRTISRRAYDEDVFSHVLTPFFNAAHRDHFHLDLARYRGDGTRPES
ncbi:MAG TPA: extensin family protein [Polyangiaceae bacterium]